MEKLAIIVTLESTFWLHSFQPLKLCLKKSQKCLICNCRIRREGFLARKFKHVLFSNFWIDFRTLWALSLHELITTQAHFSDALLQVVKYFKFPTFSHETCELIFCLHKACFPIHDSLNTLLRSPLMMNELKRSGNYGKIPIFYYNML